MANAAGGCGYHDDVDLLSNHLLSEVREALRSPLGIPTLHDKVATLGVSQIAKALEQRIVEFFVSL